MRNRWFIAFAGTLLQLCLGTIYAWSYFQKPIVEACGWTNTQVAWVFSLAICFLGLAAASGGMNLRRFGPRKLAIIGGLLFGVGNMLAGLALHLHSLPLLYLGYGVIGGTGLGLGYVTPVATVARWFPDKKGFVTGMVIMGFGFGALLMSKVVAPQLISMMNGDLVRVFGIAGVIFTFVTVACGMVLRNPPSDPRQELDPRGDKAEAESPSLSAGLLAPRFAMMWVLFFCNIVAGIAIIGFQSPMLQDLLSVSKPRLTTAELAAAGATLIAVSSLFNGLGRLFWGAVSDRMGRVRVFQLMLATQAAAFLVLARISDPWLFAVLVCYVLLCYGGGFGTMPSFVLDVFGSRRMPAVYGAILTAWSVAGIVGPQIVAWLKDRQPQNAGSLAFYIGAAFLMIGFAFSLLLGRRQRANH